MTEPDLTDWNTRFEYARKVTRNGPMAPTADHLTLLARSSWSWDDCEFGAAAMDPKRPYGSDPEADLAELLPHLSEHDRLRIHCELSAVLMFMARNWPAVTTPKRYALVDDDDGHAYVIEADRRDDWYSLSDDEINAGQPWVWPIGGASSQVTFTAPQIFGEPIQDDLP